MKDATGELSMTAVAVVAIAAIGVVFSTLIWPTIKANIQRSMHCSQAFNCDCTNPGNGICTCSYYDANNTLQTNLTCPDNSTKAGNTATE